MIGHRTRLMVACAALAFIVAPALGASSARAAEASGCSGSAESYGPAGGRLDSVSAPGAGGEMKDPFDVYSDGSVRWRGQLDAPVGTGEWKVELGGPIGALLGVVESVTGANPLSGDITNSAVTTKEGEFEVGDYAGASNLSGLVKVDVRITGDGGAQCTATVWVRLNRSFWGSVVALGGLGMVAIGGVLLFAGLPTAASETAVYGATHPPVGSGRPREGGGQQ